MIFGILFLLLLVVIMVIAEIYYRNKQSNRVRGNEDQQRYGAKFSKEKIVSYSKKWWGWKKK